MRRPFAAALVAAHVAAVIATVPIRTPAAAASVASHRPPPADALAEVLAHPRRDGDRMLDRYRHPARLLDFCDIRPGMTVVDYMPAGGFHTRILVPWLGEEGRYLGLTPDPASTPLARHSAYFAALPDLSRRELAAWKLPGARAAIVPMQDVPLALDGGVDRILLARGMHLLLGARALDTELAALRRLLRPDGLLCVVQHRARAWADGDYTDGSKGYLRQSDVIGLVEAHGYSLLETSEISANPRDPANHPDGVWGLPPVLAGDLASQAIGESDSMTLKFRKR